MTTTILSIHVDHIVLLTKQQSIPKTVYVQKKALKGTPIS